MNKQSIFSFVPMAKNTCGQSRILNMSHMKGFLQQVNDMGYDGSDSPIQLRNIKDVATAELAVAGIKNRYNHLDASKPILTVTINNVAIKITHDAWATTCENFMLADGKKIRAIKHEVIAGNMRHGVALLLYTALITAGLDVLTVQDVHVVNHGEIADIEAQERNVKENMKDETRLKVTAVGLLGALFDIGDARRANNQLFTEADSRNTLGIKKGQSQKLHGLWKLANNAIELDLRNRVEKYVDVITHTNEPIAKRAICLASIKQTQPGIANRGLEGILQHDKDGNITQPWKDGVITVNAKLVNPKDGDNAIKMATKEAITTAAANKSLPLIVRQTLQAIIDGSDTFGALTRDQTGKEYMVKPTE